MILTRGYQSPFNITEQISYYMYHYKHQTRKVIFDLLGKKKVARLEVVFNNAKKLFNAELYFCWGDANFSNILGKQEHQSTTAIKLVNFEKVGYSYLARDFATLYYSILIANTQLGNHFLTWLKSNISGKNFWENFYFKLLIYSLPRQFLLNEQEGDEIRKNRVRYLLQKVAREYFSLMAIYRCLNRK